VPREKIVQNANSYIQFAYIHFPLFLDEKWNESMPSNNAKEHFNADTTIHRSITPISKERDAEVKRPCGTLHEVLVSRLPELIRRDITETNVFVSTVLLP
jgi:hypothetical protein